ncbi:hypothetical protein FB451DRAFT_1215093 [Mycena latifolia]|nr:hypothetical protein FB451DRAFT_1215093 [Mycena latifolia]
MKCWSTTGLEVNLEVETSMKFTLYFTLLSLAALACCGPTRMPSLNPLQSPRLIFSFSSVSIPPWGHGGEH